MTNEPITLPMTRQEAWEIAERWWLCPGDHVLDNLLQDLGLTFADDLPKRRWPAKLAAKPDYGLIDAETGEAFCAVCAAEGEADVCEELARRWNRCEELEHDIDEGWRRSAQIDRGIIEEQRESIETLMDQLVERTRERDEARAEASKWASEALRQLGEARAELRSALKSRQMSDRAADAAVAERDELRRRCDAALREINKSTHEGHYREAESGALDCGTCRAREILAGRCPVPGDGGGDA